MFTPVTHAPRALILPLLALSLYACGPAPVGQTPALPGSTPLPIIQTSPAASASPLPASPAPSASSATPGQPASPGPAPSSSASATPAPASTAPIAGIASLRLNAGERFLSGSGAQTRISVEALDAAGQAMSALPALEWSSSRPQDLSVDASGQVTALVDEGFAEIRAGLPGGLSASVLISVSSPQSGGSGGSGGGSGSDEHDDGPIETKDFKVNTSTEDYQSTPDVALDGDGNFVVVWTDESNRDIRGQRFDAEGKPRGSEFLINTFTSGNQTEPRVAADKQGNFVVVWQSSGQDGDGLGVYGQRYTSRGRGQGEEFQIDTLSSGNQMRPAVTMDGDGDFVVAWTDSSARYGNGYDVLARRYSSDGEADAIIQLSDAISGNQDYADLASNQAGEFIAVWNSDGTLQARRFDADGEAIEASFTANATCGAPRVALDEDGDFAIGWSELVYEVVIFKNNTYSRHYTRDGEAIAEAQLIDFGGNEFFSDIVLTPDGGHLVAWTQDSPTNLTAQRYNRLGQPSGDVLNLGSGKSNDYIQTQFDRNDAGQYVAVWAGGIGGDDAGIGARLFSLD